MASKSGIRFVEVILVLAALGLAAWLIIPLLGRGNVDARRQACLANLGQIGQAMGHYLHDNDERWPYIEKMASFAIHDPSWPTLPSVLSPYLAGQAAVYHCPADRRTLADDSPLRSKFSKSTTWFETEGTSYEYWIGETYAGKKVGEESRPKTGGLGLSRADLPLLTDFEPFHEGDDQGPFNTLNADLKPRVTRAKTKT